MSNVGKRRFKNELSKTIYRRNQLLLSVRIHWLLLLYGFNDWILSDEYYSMDTIRNSYYELVAFQSHAFNFLRCILILLIIFLIEFLQNWSSRTSSSLCTPVGFGKFLWGWVFRQGFHTKSLFKVFDKNSLREKQSKTASNRSKQTGRRSTVE